MLRETLPRPGKKVQVLPDDPVWYKEALIYQLHVKAFYDSNGDGIGDFQGLAQKLDYIQELGVNTIWLLPFYPSPLRDDGYDIADYRSVHPDYGTMRDFRNFVHEAHRRGLRVVTELVINHTSDQHPWFQAARRASPGSAKRRFYVWSDTDKKYADTRIIFTDTEKSNWAWDSVAQQYYWHRFFSHQPDLNFDNPQVVKAVTSVMRFWLDAGVDGLRLDAIPYLCEREGTNNENLPESHVVLKRMRAEMDAHYRNRMFLAEANQWPEDVRPYFGADDECHMAFHFPLMPRIYMGVAQEDRHPIAEILDQTPDIPESCQWAVFLRNHDELTLEMVTDKERDYMYQIYAGDPRMRLNVGIRRRLAPLMDNDIERIKLLNNLLMSLIGSPVIYYGDEIGMGDNIFLGDRNGVRTPMQWSPDRNAGFSRADPARLYLPPIMDPIYGYGAVNVEAQARDPFSLLHWMRRLISVRKAHQAFGRGTLKLLRPGNRKILVYLREYDAESILCVTNLSRAAQPVELDLSAYKGRVPVELMGRSTFPPIGDLPYLLTLPGYGFYWFRLAADVAKPSWHEDRPPLQELPLLVLFGGWRTFFPDQMDSVQRPMAEKLRLRLEHEVWPRFLAASRWFAGKGDETRRVELVEAGEWTEPSGSWLISIARAHGQAISQPYFMPLALVWGDTNDEQIRAAEGGAQARVRQGARLGLLLDAFSDGNFCRAVVQAMGAGREVAIGVGRLRFVPTNAFAKLRGDGDEPLAVRMPGREQSNSSVVLGERLILKGYRRLEEGSNPELEIGRFLTDVSPFSNVAPVAGHVEYQDAAGRTMTVALLQGFVPNQGDGWQYVVDFVEWYLDARRANAGQEQRLQEARQSLFMNMVRQLGVRTGELHRALARTTGDAAFDPEPVSAAEVRAWYERVQNDVKHTLAQLRQVRERLPDNLQGLVEQALALENELMGLATPPDTPMAMSKSRYHGDYHLGQVLVVHNDFMIIDFEGEPARTLAERRAKHSPLRDVAGMLRSFNYAGFTALTHVASERSEEPAALEPLLPEWEHGVAAMFLEGYREAIAGAPTYPVVSKHAERLIDLFVLEKALYEVRYELSQRPDWVRIPLRGILALAAGGRVADQPG